MAVNEKIRIRLKSYDHTLIDTAAEKIVDVAKRSGATVSGPVPLPTEKEIVTILRAVHKYKDSREQFEMRTHKRLIEGSRRSNRCDRTPCGRRDRDHLKSVLNRSSWRNRATENPKRQPIAGGENEKRHYWQEARYDPDLP